jgi:hypothetical protein
MAGQTIIWAFSKVTNSQSMDNSPAFVPIAIGYIVTQALAIDWLLVNFLDLGVNGFPRAFYSQLINLIYYI